MVTFIVWIVNSTKYKLEKTNEKLLWNCFANTKNDILQFNQYIKSDKMLYMIYADIEF